MKNHGIIAGALGLALVAAPGASHAQAWIGQVVGDMAARQAEAAREQACRSGTPAPEPVRAHADRQTTALMTAYFDLSSRSRARDIDRVFARNQSTWMSVDGSIHVTSLGERLDIPTPTLTRRAFVVAGDEMTARGVWSAVDEAGANSFYAVDFTSTPGFFSGATWRIKAMTIFPGDQQPENPGVYCHYDPEQAWRLQDARGSG